VIIVTSFGAFATPASATTKGLSQIVTPDLQGPGDLSLSLQIQDKRIANPYELQAEMGLTNWAPDTISSATWFSPTRFIFGANRRLKRKAGSS
jgi:hypothetical protein